MPSGIVTARPTTTAPHGGWIEQTGSQWTITGAANAVAALSDNSDTTYVTSPAAMYGSNPYVLQIPIAAPSPTLPSNQSVAYALIRVRLSNLGGGSTTANPLQVYVGTTTQRTDTGAISLVTTVEDSFADSSAINSATTVSGHQIQKNPTSGQWWLYDYPAAGGLLTQYGMIDVIQLATTWASGLHQYRVYEVYVDYFYDDDPATPVAGTATGVATPRPNVPWTYSDTESDFYLYTEQWWYTAAQYGAGGFVAGQPPYVNYQLILPNGFSGTNATTYNTSPSTDLANGTTYKVYSRVLQVIGSKNSPIGASAAIAVTFETPPAPVLTATLDNPNGRVQLVAQARDNLLSFTDSCLEPSGIGGWTGTNAALSSAIAVFQGTHALALQSSAAGDFKATTPTGTSACPAVAGSQYTAMAWAKRNSATTDRSVRIDINWYTAAGALISTTNGTGTTINNAAFVQVPSNTATAPATTAFASVTVTVVGAAAANEIYWTDQISFAPGNNTTDWNPGGMTASTGFTGPSAGTGQTILIERSADGGTTWATVRPIPVSTNLVAIPDSQIATGTQLATTVYDYEAPLGVSVIYRARTITTMAVGDAANPSATNVTILTGPNSASTTGVTVTSPTTGQGFYLKNIVTGTVLAVDVTDNTFDLDFPLQVATYYPIGRPDPVVVSDVANLVNTSTTFEFLTDAAWTTFRDSIFKSLRTCLLQKYDGQQWYIQFQGTGTVKEQNGPSPVYRTFRAKWTEVARP